MLKTSNREKFGIEIPILTSGMTGVRYGERIAAVANADTLGLIKAHMFPTDEALNVIARAAGKFFSPVVGLSANAFKAVIDIDLLGAHT